MSRRRVFAFAAPLVVVSACNSRKEPPEPKHTNPPKVEYDAASAKPPPAVDAAPAKQWPITYQGYMCIQGEPGKESTVPCPDELLPVAEKDAIVVASYSEFRSLGRRLVKGPANAELPSPMTIDKGGGKHINLDESWFKCEEWEDMSCPPGATCNPPPPQEVPCPDALLPKLVPGVAPTSRKNKECFLGEVEVACPAGDLSPPAVASIADPSGKYDSIYIDTQSFDCWGEQNVQCDPGDKCNPPAPSKVSPCPDALLPTLVNGDKPTKKKDGTCWWKTTQVRCE
jgi:hypothetical protein